MGLRWKTLLHLYRSLIRSKLDYGVVVRGSARKSYPRMLEPIQNQALRTSRCFRTSPVTRLHVEANEMPLDLRRRKLSSHYCLRVSSNVTNPVRSCIFNPQFAKLFHNNPNHIRLLGLRTRHDLLGIGFIQKDTLLTSVPSTPPWYLLSSPIDFSLNTFNKSDTNPNIFQRKFLEICEGLQDYHHIYTDGSKINNLFAPELDMGPFLLTQSNPIQSKNSWY